MQAAGNRPQGPFKRQETLLDSPQGKSLPLLGALCLILAALEYLIPKPLPFLRLGLANLPLILAIDALSPGAWFALVGIKLLAQALIGGTLVSWIFLFSLAGTISSALVMYLVRKTVGARYISLVGVSLAGAMASNLAQLALARIFIFGESARYMAPALLGAGIASGLLLGFFASRFAERSAWYRSILGKSQPAGLPSADRAAGNVPEQAPWEDTQSKTGRARFAPFVLALLALGCALAYSAIDRLALKGLLVLFYWFSAAFEGRRVSALRILVSSAGIIFFSLLVPAGEVLAMLGPLPITSGALHAGLDRALSVEGLLILSRAFIKLEVFTRGLSLAKSGRLSLIERTLSAFARLSGPALKRFDPRKPIESIDKLILMATEDSSADTGRYRQTGRTHNIWLLLLPHLLLFLITVTVYLTKP